MIASMRPEGIDRISRSRVAPRGRDHRKLLAGNFSHKETLLGNLTPLFNSGHPESSDTSELAEEDVWGMLSSSPVNSPSSSRSRRESSLSPKAAPGSRLVTTSHIISHAATSESSGYDGQLLGPRSAPVKVPDWTKLTKAYDQHADEDEDDREDKLHPHEIVARELARKPMTAFSVIEGAGRTLKGRDLSNVRNAVWRQTGFFG